MIKALLEEHKRGFLLFEKGSFHVATHARNQEKNRHTLARFCSYLEEQEKGISVRTLFRQIEPPAKCKELPQIVREDPLLAYYALGRPLSISHVQTLLKSLSKGTARSLQVGYLEENLHFYDVDATPPGVLPKLFPLFRLKADHDLLEKVRYDLLMASKIQNASDRKAITFALLSFSAAYRELSNCLLDIPNFDRAEEMISYHCRQHLIGEGVKTISLYAGPGYPAIYLCQGTELWPSQPSTLGSILANLAEHGSATQVYAHSWRRIHKQLRDLHVESGSLPYVLGHSMGGSLATQIALYSHDLIAAAHAYNPPVPNGRDAAFFNTLPDSIKKKLHLYVNLDDPVFWHIGAAAIGGEVTLLLGEKRWRYYPLTLRDSLFFFPAIIKIILNMIHAFPAHQRIIPLCKSYMAVKLSDQEMALENQERTSRFDYIHFLPKLYDPLKAALSLVRRLFKWSLEEEYLANEIEIIALHERDLIDTKTVDNSQEVEEKVRALGEQKTALQKKLFTLQRK